MMFLEHTFSSALGIILAVAICMVIEKAKDKIKQKRNKK